MSQYWSKVVLSHSEWGLWRALVDILEKAWSLKLRSLGVEVFNSGIGAGGYPLCWWVPQMGLILFPYLTGTLWELAVETVAVIIHTVLHIMIGASCNVVWHWQHVFGLFLITCNGDGSQALPQVNTVLFTCFPQCAAGRNVANVT